MEPRGCVAASWSYMLYTILNAKKLNLGSGADIRTGWVNLDIGNITGVDIVHDIEKLPLPFDDDRFEEILCNDILAGC
jgi:hypothetical protein